MYEGSEDESGDFPQKIINLDLGIGTSADSSERGLTRNKKIKQEKKEPLFTAAQLLELYNQILVYNSIALGLPLAFHLLLPSWMSVFNSLGPAIYKKYPGCEYSFFSVGCSVLFILSFFYQSECLI